jgi:toxin ParE1/3/4
MLWQEDAAEELRAEVSWLDEQSSGLGGRLLDDVAMALRTIEEFPQLGAHRSHGCRRFLLVNFPFDLVYSLSDDRILVLALAHHRRRPGYWKERRSK